MNRWKLSWSSLLVMLAVLRATPARGQSVQSAQISIRMLDCYTGRPMKHRWLSVYTSKADAYNYDSRKRPPRKPPNFRIHSNAKGTAVLEVRDALPVELFVLDPGDFWPAGFSVSAILQSGDIGSKANCGSGQHSAYAQAGPGEFVYWGHRPTFAERLESLIPGI